MKTVGKVAIVASIVLVAGIVISGVAFTQLAKKGLNNANTNMVTVDFDFDEQITGIDVSAVSDDICILQSEDDKTHVHCVDYEEVEHDAYIEGDTLYVTTEVGTDTYFTFDLFTDNTPRIYVYLPEEEYEDLMIKATTADVAVGPGFRFENMTIDVTTGDIALTTLDCTDVLDLHAVTGDITLNDIDCNDLVYNGTTGDIEFVNVLASGDVTIDVTTGDIDFEAVDAANINLECTTGDVSMSLLSDMIFDVHVVTGDVNVPRSGDGDELGECIVKVTTGDIYIDVA